MDNYLRYDNHCHIFTLKYAIKEIKSMLHDMWHETYPFDAPSGITTTPSSKKEKLQNLMELLRQLYEIIHAAGTSEEENLNFLQKELKKAFPTDTLRITPLMMDIFYMLAYPLEKDMDLVAQTTENRYKSIINDVEIVGAWREILDDFESYLTQKEGIKFKSAIMTTEDKLHQYATQLIEEERDLLEPKLTFKKTTIPQNIPQTFYKTEGYTMHMNNLLNLVESRNGELYPFVAIDPRRPGIVDTLLSGAFFEGKRKFSGVKLYPRMGVHPLSKPMDAVYKYCSDNNIPIIYHCGKAGFPPKIENWPYNDYGNPLNFEPIVKKYPLLKIDFAHMGTSDPTYEWADTIVRLVNENDNVYSDISCYTNEKELAPMKKYWDENPKLRARLMFGTDFDVMYLVDRVTMQGYYDNFKKVFSASELNLLMHDNPMRFMNHS